MAKKNLRPISVNGKLAYVPLTRGLTAIIDADDIDRVSGDNWQASLHGANCYAGRSQWTGAGYIKIKMHRVILGAPDGLFVDHIDGNGLNNSRGNLRLATNAQNCWNQRLASNNKTGKRGVFFNARRNCWQASIRHNGKLHWLGRHSSLEKASEAYDEAAVALFGPFARLV